MDHLTVGRSRGIVWYAALNAEHSSSESVARQENSLKERTQCHQTRWLLRQFLMAGFVLLFALIQAPTSVRAVSPDYQLVRLRFKDQTQLQNWIDGGLDVWHVDGTTALVSVAKRQMLTLEAEGFDVQSVSGPASPSFPACYRTYDDMLTFFHEREASYPELFQLSDVGGSWEKQNGLANRHLYVGRVTSPQGPEKKPKLFLVAEHHAREIVTPEVAMNFIDDLLKNYGQDPTVTWLLDHREVWVMPMANPDGHVRAEQLENWRKNTRTTDTCDRGVLPPNSYGVDLNRNYGYEWGLPNGSSSEPCNRTYRGSGPFSEPETMEIQHFVEQNHFALLVSLHSWGDVVLFPWAYTYHPTADSDSLYRIADRMAEAVDYTAAQSALGVHYLSSGDLTDWAYGDLGIPSFTIEIGGLEDGGFWPDCSTKDQLYQELRPALVYAALAADHPYDVAGGPEARQIVVDVNEPTITVRTRVSDQWTGGDAIQGAEVFLEAVGEPGTGIALLPADGDCNSSSEWLMANLDPGVYMRYAGRRVPLIVVAQDVTGKRGVPTVTWLDLRGYPVPGSVGVRLWAVGAQDPTFEIKGGYVYQGPAEAGHILMTVRQNRVYRGAGTLGEVLYTLGPGQVRAGEAGPVIYTVQGNDIYAGPLDRGVLIYRVEDDRLLEGGSVGDDVVLTANVDLAGAEVENATLLLPILADRRY